MIYAWIWWFYRKCEKLSLNIAFLWDYFKPTWTITLVRKIFFISAKFGRQPETLVYQDFRPLLAIKIRRSLMEWFISFISEVTFRENSFWFLTSSLIKYSSLMTRYTDNTRGNPLFAISFSIYSISIPILSTWWVCSGCPGDRKYHKDPALKILHYMHVWALLPV